jgi:signal transduction histidine kinase
MDLSLGLFLTAASKVLMGVAGVVILDALCSVELGVVSWVIVAVPFIMVALASSIALGLGMDRVASKYLTEKFTPLTGDNLKNRNRLVTQLKDSDALPLSSSSMY